MLQLLIYREVEFDSFKSFDLILFREHIFFQMKKGKRQVVQRNVFQQEGEDINGGIEIPSSYLANQVQSTNDNHGNQGNLQGLNSKLPSQQRRREEVQKSGDSSRVAQNGDEKKSRIQMLKQKYLKKTVNNKATVSQPEVKEEQAPIQIKKSQVESQSSEQKPEIVRKVVKEAQELPKQQVQMKRVEKSDQIKQQVNLQAQHFSQQPKIAKKPFNVPPPPPPRKQAKKPIQEELIQEPEKVVVQNKKQSPNKFKIPQPPKKSTKTNPVQQIIAKRLKKEVPLPKKEVIIQDRQIYDEYSPSLDVNFESANVSSMPLDEEFIDKNIDKMAEQKPQSVILPINQPEVLFSVGEGVQMWCGEGDFLIKVLSKNSSLKIDIQNPLFSKSLNLQSKNPGYKDTISKMLKEFVFGSQGQLTEGQREVLDQLALEYFFSSGSELTIQFLLSTVKLGSSHLKKYISFFKQNSFSYCRTILRHKKCFLPQELSQFVDFIIDNQLASEEMSYLLILLQPTENLSNFCLSQPFVDYKNIMMCLGACQWILKTNKQVLGMYLRLIGLFVEGISQQKMLLQTILQYLNQIESHQKYYQYQKQLKLKVINLMSNSNTQQAKVENRQEKGEGKGIMGFWNKTMNSIKTTANQLVKEQRPKSVETEAPEENIIYDPVLKRYVIDGQVPIDDEEQASKFQAPPPPPPKPKGVVAPPQPGARKGRTVTATNRYA